MDEQSAIDFEYEQDATECRRCATGCAGGAMRGTKALTGKVARPSRLRSTNFRLHAHPKNTDISTTGDVSSVDALAPKAGVTMRGEITD